MKPSYFIEIINNQYTRHKNLDYTQAAFTICPTEVTDHLQG